MTCRLALKACTAAPSLSMACDKGKTGTPVRYINHKLASANKMKYKMLMIWGTVTINVLKNVTHMTLEQLNLVENLEG